MLILLVYISLYQMYVVMKNLKQISYGRAFTFFIIILKQMSEMGKIIMSSVSVLFRIYSVIQDLCVILLKIKLFILKL